MKSYILAGLLSIVLAGCSNGDRAELGEFPNFSEVTGAEVEVTSNFWVDDTRSQMEGDVYLVSHASLPADYEIEKVILYQGTNVTTLSKNQLDLDISNESLWEIHFQLNTLKLSSPIDVLVLLHNDREKAWLIDKNVSIDRVTGS
ncbi:hypothetical protein [Vibrio salinus]|uniref:hypothetical protein n=1 Tax=Vibrio salinus TaxID=2899784 RepID=UPI001E3B0E90|nr:hypothetical protein [Vibrio salinus]MCE0494284.1 hypothetical protein [Vibrio salinus]